MTAVFKNVLYPIDLQAGQACHRALPHVVAQVRAWQASLCLMTVIPGFGMPWVATYFPEGAEQTALDKARQQLAAYVKDNVPADIAVTSLVCEGSAYEEILREAEARNTDLIIIPSQDRSGVEKFLLGSTAWSSEHVSGAWSRKPGPM